MNKVAKTWKQLNPKRTLFGRYLWLLAGSSLLVVLGGGALQSRLMYDEALDRVREIQAAEANLATANVTGILRPIETDALRYAGLPWQEFTDQFMTRHDEARRFLTRHSTVQQIEAIEQQSQSGFALSRQDRTLRLGIPTVAVPDIGPTATEVEYTKVNFAGNSPNMDMFVRDKYSPGQLTRFSLDLRFLTDALAMAVRDSQSDALIVDDDGVIVAHNDAAVALRKSRMPQTGEARAWLDRIQSVPMVPLHRLTDFDGQDVLATSVRLPQLRWNVVVQKKASVAMAAVRRAIWLTLAVAGAAGLLSVYLATILARRLTRPIRQMQIGASAIAAGDWSQKLPADSTDELGSLAIAFNSMSTDLRATYGDLENRVEEKTRDLAAANQQLEVINRHKSEFLAHMSHELRTPLNAVIGFSDLLKAQYFGPLNQKQSEYVRDINASGQHLLSLINDILDLAKVEAGRMELVLSDCHVPTLVESCVALVSERVSRSQQTLTTDVSPKVATWPLDERKVKQCLLNLLTNASKFTPVAGAITLRLWLLSNDRDERSELVAAVSDNGVGIAAEDMPKLFSEFYQAKAIDDASGIAAQREGTGLGLALTKGFVELHGGTISVESVIGKGSTFTMRFPAKSGASGDTHIEEPNVNGGSA